MPTANVIRLPSVQEQQYSIRKHLEDVIASSFPLYTFKELKSLLRCEYHRFVMALREDKTWEEISALTGMSRAGLNKLGDERVPAQHHNAIRNLWAHIARCGDEGASIGELAATFYESAEALDGPDFKDCIKSLMEAQVVEHRAQRYYATRPLMEVRGQGEAFSDTAVETVSKIAQGINESEGATNDFMVRASFAISSDEDKQRQFYREFETLVMNLCQYTDESANTENQPPSTITLVLAGGINVQ